MFRFWKIRKFRKKYRMIQSICFRATLFSFKIFIQLHCNKRTIAFIAYFLLVIPMSAKQYYCYSVCYFQYTFTVNSFHKSQVHFSYRVIGMLQNLSVKWANYCVWIFTMGIILLNVKIEFYIFVLQKELFRALLSCLWIFIDNNFPWNKLKRNLWLNLTENNNYIN